MTRHPLLWLSLLPLLVGCGRLETIPSDPPQTPTTWLTIQPYIHITLFNRDVILIQPTSTLFVYTLGLLAIGIGLYAWRSWQKQVSRSWWSIALLLWGIGALLAGTSYEAFSYHLKCAGRAVCVWTNGWELAYLVLSVASINAMMLAQAYACASGRWRKSMSRYAITHTQLYAGLVALGAVIPNPFLISFEFLILVIAPTLLFFVWLNGRRYWRDRQEMDLALLRTWLGLGSVMGLYFLYYVLGITPWLWRQGIWFSDNDVLHLGLIAWMGYIARAVLPRVVDAAAVNGR
ncbi:MAG: hypothetical protein R3E31_02495 [Chloroflexota bacterium]